MSNPPFRIGATNDGVFKRLSTDDAVHRTLAAAANVELVSFPETGLVGPGLLDDFDAVIAGGFRITPESTAGVERCAAIVRYGAGYDLVDLDACTEAGIILATTPVGVRRPVATAALTYILTLSTRILCKSKFVYDGQWAQSKKSENNGIGLTGKTIGLVGFGGIGRDLAGLIKPFAMRRLVYDPYIDEQTARDRDVQLVDLSALMSESDFVITLCALTGQTHHLIGEAQLRLMKPSAFFINVARGPIVDQKALTRALAQRRIAGAGLDVFDPEPIEPGDPILELDNVLLTPHALAITDEMVQSCNELTLAAALAVMRGELPDSVINRPVLDSPKLQARLKAYSAACGSEKGVAGA